MVSAREITKRIASPSAGCLASVTIFLTLIIVLFGDNLIGRIGKVDAPDVSNQPDQPSSLPTRPLNESSTPNLELPKSLTEPVELPSWLLGICDFDAVSVSFRAEPSDASQFARRASGVVVPISRCDQKGHEFETRYEHNGSGIFVGGQGNFTYKYFAEGGMTTCHVDFQNGSVLADVTEAVIFCEGSSDLSSRDAKIRFLRPESR